MKNQPEFITKMQEKVEEIRLAQEGVSLAITDTQGIKKGMSEIESTIKDLKGFAVKAKDQKLQGLLLQMEKAYNDVELYLL
jgi:chaperonin cofactor prefoldin